MLKAIGFDFDGVFVDSNELKIRSIKNILEKENLISNNFDYIVRREFGKSRKELIRKCLKEPVENDVLENIYEEVSFLINEKYEKLEIINFEIVCSEIKKLSKEYEIYIITGSPEESVKEIIGDLNDYIYEIISTNDRMHKHNVINEIKKSKNFILYAGDSYLDYTSSISAGVDFVFIYGSSVASADDKKLINNGAHEIYENLSSFLLKSNLI